MKPETQAFCNVSFTALAFCLAQKKLREWKEDDAPVYMPRLHELAIMRMKLEISQAIYKNIRGSKCN